MHIIERVVKDGEIEGVILDIEGTSVPVTLHALHSREIFDGLIESGWVFKAFPYEFDFQGMSISDIPKEIEFANLTPQEKAEFHIVEGESYSHDELMGKLPTTEDAGIPWREPVFHSIQTRQQLLDFLLKSADFVTTPSNEATYLPLNAICNPDALFTFEEYVDVDNKIYVDIIERRRQISFACYERLVEQFKILGMREDYTKLDFLDFYFSWGICGIKTRRLATETTFSDVSFRTRFRPFDQQAGVTTSKLALMNDEGEVLPKLDPGYRLLFFDKDPDFNQKEINRRAGLLKENEVLPVYVKAVSREEIRTIVCDGFKLLYTEDDLELYCTTVTIIRPMPSFRVTLPVGEKSLDNSMYNLQAATTYNNIYMDCWIEALSSYVMEKVTVHSNATSYRALQAVGLSAPNALQYMTIRDVESEFQKGDGEDGELATSSNRTDFITNRKLEIENMRSFCMGQINEDDSPELFNMFSELVQEAVSGSTLLDGISSGAIADATLSKDDIRVVMKAAISLLDIKPKDIIVAIDSWDGEAITLPLHSSDGRYISVPMTKRNNQQMAYGQDIEQYIVDMATEAEFWMFVEHVYSEPKQEEGRAKHAACRYLTFRHNRTTARGNLEPRHYEIENAIKDKVDEAIYNMPVSEHPDLYKKTPIFVAEALFQIYKHGREAKFNPHIGGGIINPAPALIQVIQQGGAISEFADTLLSISEHMTGLNGRFQQFIVNAVVMPELVIPKRTADPIKETPFITACPDISTDYDMQSKYVQLGHHPYVGYRGLRAESYTLSVYPFHADFVDEFVKADKTRVLSLSPFSIAKHFSYLENYSAKRIGAGLPLNTALSVAQRVYPEIYGTSNDEDFDGNLLTDGQPKPSVNWDIMRPRTITQEIVYAEWPEYAEMFFAQELDDKAGETERGVNIFHKMRDFTIKDMLFIPRETILNFAAQFEGKIPVAYTFGVVAQFTDETIVNFEDSSGDNVDVDKYAVFKYQSVQFVRDQSGVIYRRG